MDGGTNGERGEGGRNGEKGEGGRNGERGRGEEKRASKSSSGWAGKVEEKGEMFKLGRWRRSKGEKK